MTGRGFSNQGYYAKHKNLIYFHTQQEQIFYLKEYKMDNKELAAELLKAVMPQIPLLDHERTFPSKTAEALLDYYFAILNMLDEKGTSDKRFSNH